MVIKEMGVVPEDNDQDTIRLLLDLPRTLDTAKLTALIADLSEVRTVKVE